MRLSLGYLSAVLVAAVVPLLAVADGGGEPGGSDALAAESDESVALARIGDYVQRYYARTQHVVSLERVTLQPLGHDLQPDGHPRRLEYELRVEWQPVVEGRGPIANVLRHLLKVGGRPARPGDEPGCMDPRSVSPEPLAILLPGRRDGYVFNRAGVRRTGSRSAVMLDYKPSSPAPPVITWQDECVTVDLPGRTVGRVWADAATGEILRFDEHLVGHFDVPLPASHQRRVAVRSMVIERADTSIRYKPVAFRDPDETLLLPASIDTVTVVRDAAVPRMRTMQSFSNYRRFVTDAHVVGEQ